MAKKKKTTRKKSGGLFGFFSKKKKGRRKARSGSPSTGVKVTLSIMFLTVLAGGGAVGLIYLEQYVTIAAEKAVPDGSLKLINPPSWLNQDWVDKLVKTADGKRFPLNDASAQNIARRLESLSWLDNVRVQTTPEFLTVRADYRRPVAWVLTADKEKVYLDGNMYVLEYIPISGIPVVQIVGLASRAVPAAGQQWLADDAKAAVELLNWLNQMDRHFQSEKEKRDQSDDTTIVQKIPEKPLLNEIESIDVSNFSAPKNRSAPNIVFRVKGGVQVYWGAAWGQSAVYVEAPEKQKLARLYQWFVDHDNTLMGTAKHIELRWLEDSIPRPR